jgi:hypothetical protein
MAVTGNKGIDVRQTANRIIARALLQTSAGALVTTGTTNLSILELQTDGTLKTYDFSSNTFKASGMTSGQSVAAMTYRARIGTSDAAVDTGLWTYVLSTLSGFTAGAIYFFIINNSSASPTDQVREFQFGDAQGDQQVDSSGYHKVSTGTGTGQINITAGKVDLIDAPNATAVAAIQAGLSTLTATGVWGYATRRLSDGTNIVLAKGTGITGFNDLDAAGVRTALGLASANLDSQLTALSTAVGNLNNLSALANLYGPPILEIPDSSSTLFPFTLTIRDSEGHLVDADSTPTITATNAAGTDRSANLSAVSHPATGRYSFTYSVSSAAAEEGLRIEATGAVGASSRYAIAIVAVANYDSITTLAAIKAKSDLIGTNAADSPNAATAQTNVAAVAAKLPAGGLIAGTDNAQDILDAVADVPTASQNATAAAAAILVTPANKLQTNGSGFVRVYQNDDKTGYALTVPANTAIALAVELAILDDTDGDAVLQAIVNKINSVDTDLASLSIAAIAQASSDKIERAGGMLALTKAQADKIGTDTGDGPAAQTAQGRINTIHGKLPAGNIGDATSSAQTTLSTAVAALASKLGGMTSLPNWLRAFFRKSAPDATAATEINAVTNSVVGTFDATTDSTQAIRDRGDTAWLTGEGGGGDNTGTGSITVNHNTGGSDNLRVLDSGSVPVGGATIRAYLADAYAAGVRDIQGQVTTGTDGRWLEDMHLDAGTYTFTAEHDGFTIPNITQEVS